VIPTFILSGFTVRHSEPTPINREVERLLACLLAPSWVVSPRTVTEGDKVKVISGNSLYLKIGLYRENIEKPVFLSPSVT
jgi:hypothetical protein